MGALTTALLTTATVAQGVHQASQQRKAGQQAQRAADFEAGIYDLNAAQADAQAKDALARGEQAEAVYRQGTKQLVSSQIASAGAQGLALDKGSVVDLREETAYLGELDALTIRNNARREALGYRQQAQNLRLSAQLTRLGGQNAKGAAYGASTGTLLTTGVQAYGVYRSLRGG